MKSPLSKMPASDETLPHFHRQSPCERKEWASELIAPIPINVAPMADLPKISIVTPSYNQGAFLGETLQSLVDQNYPRLEAIIQEGGSKDESIAIAQSFVDRYPNAFQLHIEEDAGQADALNRGFARTTGDILGFLNSDDRLRPNCLPRVAQEIDPEEGRHVVFGRSLFFGDDPKSGQEHPSVYENRFEQLAIWKRGQNRIPQPSTFWTREAWEQCGPLDAAQSHALDYDLFCRFGQRYQFHKIDALLSEYRLHRESKTTNKSHEALMADCIAISRRYWGPWTDPLRWKCELSYFLHKRSEQPEARDALRRAEVELLFGTKRNALNRSLVAAWRSPTGFRPRILLPIAARNGWLRIADALADKNESQLCPYRWIGPYYSAHLKKPSIARGLRVKLEIPDRVELLPMEIQVGVDGRIIGSQIATQPGAFEFDVPLPSASGDSLTVSLLCDRYFVPSLTEESPDRRQLSASQLELRII